MHVVQRRELEVMQRGDPPAGSPSSSSSQPPQRRRHGRHVALRQLVRQAHHGDVQPAQHAAVPPHALRHRRRVAVLERLEQLERARAPASGGFNRVLNIQQGFQQGP